MDYTMDAVHFRERGFALLVTRWISLGAGFIPTDVKWQSHLCDRLPKGFVNHPHPPGSIRASFEDQAESSVEKITAENELKLFSKRQRKLLTRGPDGLVWK